MDDVAVKVQRRRDDLARWVAPEEVSALPLVDLAHVGFGLAAG